jgi:hypothetical protein
MRRDFDEEIRQLRQDMHDIDIVIAYFERLEAQLAVKDKRPGKAISEEAGTLLHVKGKPGTGKS